MNTMLEVQIFFLNVVNIVSREVLERHVGCCNKKKFEPLASCSLKKKNVSDGEILLRNLLNSNN